MRCAGDVPNPSEVELPNVGPDAAAACVGTPSNEPQSPSRRAWTLLTNHAHVLVCVAQHPGISMREMALSVGVTERCVQRILTELEEAGFITRVHEGRRNRYEVHADLPLRHPLEQHPQVSTLLNLVLGREEDDRGRGALE